MPSARAILSISAVLTDSGNQRVALGERINLGTFQSDFVYADLPGYPPYVLDLMFVRTDDKHLKDDMWMGCPGFPASLYKIPGAVKHRVEISLLAVLGVYIPGGAVNRDDDPVKSGSDGPTRVLRIKKMPIGGGDRVQPSVMGMPDHVQESRVDVGLPLEIKDEAQEPALKFIDDLAKEILAQVARCTREGPETAGAFRAAKVAGRRRFNRNGHRKAPLNRSAQESGQLKG